MELSELGKHWNAWGEDDPLWAILSDPQKRLNRWGLDEFFESGEREIAGLIRSIGSAGHSLQTTSALDFGCGVGRLTQALADRFARCTGVDIAPSMVAKARELNRHGDRVEYRVNARDDLSVFAANSFDLVYSSIVLQHMHPRYSLAYIREFVRVIRPGGVAVFQLPGGPLDGDERLAVLGDDMATAPLPAASFRGWIDVTTPPTTAPAGAMLPLDCQVRNTSASRWPRFGMADTRFGLRLGVRWFDAAGRYVEQHDERQFMPHSLNPGEVAKVGLVANVPKVPGEYILEVDMAQEYVGWFRDHGNRSPAYPIVVTRPAEPAPAAAADAKFSPVIEMYHVPKAEVEAAVAGAGGKVFHLVPLNGLHDYQDIVYYVTK